ncbi:MAG TPA: hypothetical protein DEP65_13670 [Ruminococcus sp.]|nr:hypothetical protein [Ruminococcus sp.]
MIVLTPLVIRVIDVIMRQIGDTTGIAAAPIIAINTELSLNVISVTSFLLVTDPQGACESLALTHF